MVAAQAAAAAQTAVAVAAAVAAAEAEAHHPQMAPGASPRNSLPLPHPAGLLPYQSCSRPRQQMRARPSRVRTADRTRHGLVCLWAQSHRRYDRDSHPVKNRGTRPWTQPRRHRYRHPEQKRGTRGLAPHSSQRLRHRSVGAGALRLVARARPTLTWRRHASFRGESDRADPASRALVLKPGRPAMLYHNERPLGVRTRNLRNVIDMHLNVAR